MAGLDYWASRQHLKYYQAVKSRIEGRRGRCIVDIGSADTPIVLWGKFERRITLDAKKQPPLPGVMHLVGRWPDIELPCRPDLAICLQTIEHQPNATVMNFTGALIRCAPTLVISVPYRWLPSADRGHLQDPICLIKLIHLMHGLEPVWLRIVSDDNVRRLVAEFQT